MGSALSIVHTSLHTTVTCSALHLSALSGRVIQLTETTGQPGIAPIRPVRHHLHMGRAQIAARVDQCNPDGASRSDWLRPKC